MPTAKYRMVASAPLSTGLTSTVPISTARYTVVSFVRIAKPSLDPAGPAGGGGIEVPRLPAPAGAVGLGGQRGQRGVVAGEGAPEPARFAGTPVAQFARQPPEAGLVVRFGARFQPVAGRVGAPGQVTPEAAGGARSLLGEAGFRVLDGDDMRGAEDPGLQ